MPAHDPEAKKLLKRFEEMASKRHTFEWAWQEISDYLIGRRDFQVQWNTPGRKRTAQIYDGTARINGSLLAGGLHSLLTNPATDWFKLRYSDEALNQSDQAVEWLELAEERMYAAIRRPRARFDSQMGELWSDLVHFGNAGILIEDVMGEGVRYSHRTLGELFFSEDAAGNVDVIARRFRLAARQALQMFGKEAPEKAQKAVDGDRAEEEATYIHMLLPNEEVAPGQMGSSGMPIASRVFCLDDAKIVSRGGFHEMPIAVVRWSTDSGEVYGRGPGMDALSDGQMLNEMKKTILKASQKAVDPPLLVDSEGVFGDDLRIEPGGVNPVNVATTIFNPPIQPIPMDLSGFPIHQTEVNETRQQVKEAYHHQLIELIRDPRMTATQVLELSGLVQRHMAPIMGRLQSELLDAIVNRTFSIELRAGRMPEIPLELGGADIRVEYLSPLVRAQKASDAKAVIDFAATVANMAQIDPGVLDIMDTDQAVRELGGFFGVPPGLLRSPEDVARRRKAMEEIARERDAERKLQIGSEAAAKLAPALREAAGTEGAP